MSDYSELKRLAEASRVANHDERGQDEAFQEALHPEVVLALISENERLSAELKAENGLLRQLASDTVLELRKASSWICREVEAGTKSATHWAVRLREKADHIDAAMAQGEQS